MQNEPANLSKPTEKHNEFIQRVTEYEREVRELGEDLNIAPSVTLEFPDLKVIPEDLKLALGVIEKYRYTFNIWYNDTSKENTL